MSELEVAQVDETVPRLALRAKDAAVALGISERTLWTLTNTGEIPHGRIGRAIVYPVDRLREYLNGLGDGENSTENGRTRSVN